MELDLSEKAVALRQAARVAAQLEELDKEMHGMIRICSYAGASLREIAEATGLSHMTVKRILDRSAKTPQS